MNQIARVVFWEATGTDNKQAITELLTDHLEQVVAADVECEHCTDKAKYLLLSPMKSSEVRYTVAIPVCKKHSKADPELDIRTRAIATNEIKEVFRFLEIETVGSA